MLPAGALLAAGRLESGHGWTRSPASSSGVARPLRPHGAGRGASLLAGQVVSRLAPPVPCSPGPPVGHRCHTAVPWGIRGGFGPGKKGVSLHLNTMAGHFPAGIPGSTSGEAPILCGTEERGLASRAESTSNLASSRSGIHGQESHSLPEQGLHLGEVCSRGKSRGAQACV